jgi:huntingtin
LQTADGIEQPKEAIRSPFGPPAKPAQAPAASAKEVLSTINHACQQRGGKYAQYSCRVVSWDDVSRGTVGGGLSCWGANITDTYLKSKRGEQLFTVRAENWNEKLGRVSASEVALVSSHDAQAPAAPVTLRDFLKSIGQRGAYAGLPTDTDLSDDALDTECSIRFQTTFLPVSGDRGAVEFASEAYNYNTTSDADPRNLVVLATTQGAAIQQDGAGSKKLFHHSVDPATGQTHRYWLEAERSDHKVGGAQAESTKERLKALARGKAVSSVIGTRAMGTRFNVLMTIQIPLEQREQPRRRDYDMCMCVMECCAAPACETVKLSELGLDMAMAGYQSSVRCVGAAPVTPPKARSNAARVSRGSEVDVWDGLTVKKPKRNKHEHVTITVVIYNTCEGGVPSDEDVLAAIDDLEELYTACSAKGKLADATFDFMRTDG